MTCYSRRKTFSWTSRIGSKTACGPFIPDGYASFDLNFDLNFDTDPDTNELEPPVLSEQVSVNVPPALQPELQDQQALVPLPVEGGIFFIKKSCTYS